MEPSISQSVPPDVLAEVRVPGTGEVEGSARAVRGVPGNEYTSFDAPSGRHVFSSVLRA
jgi:hypothetical protein